MGAPFADRLGEVRYTVRDGMSPVASYTVDQGRTASFTPLDADRPNNAEFVYYIGDTQFQTLGVVDITRGELDVTVSADGPSTAPGNTLIADTIRVIPKSGGPPLIPASRRIAPGRAPSPRRARPR